MACSYMFLVRWNWKAGQVTQSWNSLHIFMFLVRWNWKAGTSNPNLKHSIYSLKECFIALWHSTCKAKSTANRSNRRSKKNMSAHLFYPFSASCQIFSWKVTWATILKCIFGKSLIWLVEFGLGLSTSPQIVCAHKWYPVTSIQYAWICGYIKHATAAINIFSLG